RHFCGRCGSALWLWDPTWPELVHPHASAIDTPLPVPSDNAHILLGSKANWVAVEGRRGDPRFEAYPDFSLAEWHERHAAKGRARS
ncbi:MAG TPA: GFA family protein, partial [Pseudorhodoferax sp.]|nr:GFA family protein [Pseudorhodoferax sp.]